MDLAHHHLLLLFGLLVFLVLLVLLGGRLTGAALAAILLVHHRNASMAVLAGPLVFPAMTGASALGRHLVATLDGTMVFFAARHVEV